MINKTAFRYSIFTLILTLTSWITDCQPAYASTDENGLPVLGDSSSSIMSQSKERALGKALLRQLRARVATVEDPLLIDYLEHLLYLLASSSELKEPQLDLVILNSPAINAFAAPGGIIGLNAGLFLHARNEDELGAVIAHELAHLSQRHFARTLKDSKKQQWASLAAILASAVIAATAGSEAGLAALATTQAASIDQQLRFSRHNEREADRIGIQTLVRAGMDPHAMPGFFEQLLQSTRYSGTHPPEFLLTHPITQARISDSRNRAAAYPHPKRHESLEFQLMKVRTMVEFARDNTTMIKHFEATLKQGKTANWEVSQFGLAYAYYKANLWEKALPLLDQLLESRPQRITYLYTKANILKESGRVEEAKAELNKGLSFSPENFPLSYLLAQTLNRNNEPEKAIPILKQLIAKHPYRPTLWYQLAESYGASDNRIGVHTARAEYFFLKGLLPKALEQLNYAKALAKDDFSTSERIRQRIISMKQSENDLKF